MSTTCRYSAEAFFSDADAGASHTSRSSACCCITKLSASHPKQETVNALFDANVHSEEEMEAWLAARRVVNDNPKNGEEAALSKAGAKA